MGLFYIHIMNITQLMLSGGSIQPKPNPQANGPPNSESPNLSPQSPSPPLESK